MLIYVLMQVSEGIVKDGFVNYVERFLKKNCRFILPEGHVSNHVNASKEQLIFFPKEMERTVEELCEDKALVNEYLFYKPLKLLIDFYEEKLKCFAEDSPYTAVISLTRNYSLEIACERLKIPCKYIEFTALRRESYFAYDMMWLQDAPAYQCADTDAVRYTNYLNEKKKTILKRRLTPLELLVLGIKGEYLPSLFRMLFSKEEYEVGVAFSPNKRELCGEWTNEKMLEKVIEVYGKDHILVRIHPGYEEGVLDGFDVDDSKSSIDFIGRCKRIVSAGSNISFESIMMGKHTIDLSSHIYTNFVADENNFEKENTVTDEFLNYMFFGYFVPAELLFDEEYIQWRLFHNPTEVEIFDRNYKFICENYLHIDENVLNEAKDIMETIIWARRLEMDETRKYRLDVIKELVLRNWEADEGNIVICGCGINAVTYRQIIEALGGRISCYVVTEQGVNRKEFDGLPVVYYKDLKVTEDTKFVVSQRNIMVQYEVIKSIRELGENQIFLL